MTELLLLEPKACYISLYYISSFKKGVIVFKSLSDEGIEVLSQNPISLSLFSLL